MPFYVEFIDNVAVWHLDDNKNLFNGETVREMHRCLDEIEANPHVTCMISIGYGKNYSQGLDLLTLSQMDKPAVPATLTLAFKVIARVLTFPLPTIAAINGHSYGAGAFLAVCHDYRIMREDRGYMCFPEAKLGVHFGYPVLIEMIKLRIPLANQSIAILSMEMSGPEACKYGLVHETSNIEELLMTAQDAAKRLVGRNNLDRDNLKKIKSSIFASVVNADYEMIKDVDMGKLYQRVQSKL